ncbi:MAG: DUF4212 domain-containing protein [Nitrospirae bacterium]|nr:DUF4212 domain-containing protein [Nitrospirota bacterium]
MAKELAGLDKKKLQEYWSYNIKLTTITMIIWFVVTYVAIFFAPELDKIVIFGFPMGYYMGAQGSLIVFVILIFNYSNICDLYRRFHHLCYRSCHCRADGSFEQDDRLHLYGSNHCSVRLYRHILKDCQGL